MTGQEDGALAESVPSHPLGVALRLLRADAPGQIGSDPQSWPRWQVLLPHVLAAAAHTDPAATTDQAAVDNTVWLLGQAGTYLWVHARLAEARPLHERALAITEAAYGPDHPTVATRLNSLALTLRDLGEPGRARPLLERALAIRRKVDDTLNSEAKHRTLSSTIALPWLLMAVRGHLGGTTPTCVDQLLSGAPGARRHSELARTRTPPPGGSSSRRRPPSG